MKNVSPRLSQKLQSGRHGDLKLLAISIGLFIACVIGALMIRNKNVNEKAAGAPFTPIATEQQMFIESPSAESGFDIDAPNYPSQRINPGSATLKDRKDTIKDMADQIPKDQIIVF
jgi:hypothetical protein